MAREEIRSVKGGVRCCGHGNLTALTSNLVAFLFIQDSQGKGRLMIIQEVQIISVCLWTCVWVFVFLITCLGLQVQSQSESINRTDFILIITPITPNSKNLKTVSSKASMLII